MIKGLKNTFDELEKVFCYCVSTQVRGPPSFFRTSIFPIYISNFFLLLVLFSFNKSILEKIILFLFPFAILCFQLLNLSLLFFFILNKDNFFLSLIFVAPLSPFHNNLFKKFHLEFFLLKNLSYLSYFSLK